MQACCFHPIKTQDEKQNSKNHPNGWNGLFK